MEKLNSEKKITLTEFLDNYTRDLAIYCDTEIKARILQKAIRKLLKKWWNIKISDHKDTFCRCYKRDTCYSNDNCCGSRDWYETMGYTIYEFDEVDLDK